MANEVITASQWLTNARATMSALGYTQAHTRAAILCAEDGTVIHPEGMQQRIDFSRMDEPELYGSRGHHIGYPLDHECASRMTARWGKVPTQCVVFLYKRQVYGHMERYGVGYDPYMPIGAVLLNWRGKHVSSASGKVDLSALAIRYYTGNKKGGDLMKGVQELMFTTNTTTLGEVKLATPAKDPESTATSPLAERIEEEYRVLQEEYIELAAERTKIQRKIADIAAKTDLLDRLLGRSES